MDQSTRTSLIKRRPRETVFSRAMKAAVPRLIKNAASMSPQFEKMLVVLLRGMKYDYHLHPNMIMRGNDDGTGHSFLSFVLEPESMDASNMENTATKHCI